MYLGTLAKVAPVELKDAGTLRYLGQAQSRPNARTPANDLSITASSSPSILTRYHSTHLLIIKLRYPHVSQKMSNSAVLLNSALKLVLVAVSMAALHWAVHKISRHSLLVCKRQGKR